MKLIENIRDRQNIKYRKKVELYFKTKAEEKINKLIAEHSAEINDILKRKDKVIENKIVWFEKELESTREQEKKKFEVILNDKNNEIKRLKDFIEKHKKLFDNIEFKENDVEFVIKKINHKFERGLYQIAEGFQIMQLAQKEIEDCKRKYIKIEKLQEIIEA